MDIRRQNGIAMLVAMMAMLLMTALGIALIMTTSSETIIAGNYRNASEALYAADAVLERAMDDLLTVPDWNSLLTGATQSAFIDGPPSGGRALQDGSLIDLGQALNMANCQKVGACSNAEMDTVTTDRPWGPNNPRWQLYAYGNLSDMMPTDSINSSYYVIVMVADDPSENDGNPLVDGLAGIGNLGAGVLALRAEAFGPRGAHKVIEMTVSKTDTTQLERGYTGQRGQDEQNRRAGKVGIQKKDPNFKGLTMQSLDLAAGGIR